MFARNDKRGDTRNFPEERIRVIRGHSVEVLFSNFCILRSTVVYLVILLIREYLNLGRLRLVSSWIRGIFDPTSWMLLKKKLCSFITSSAAVKFSEWLGNQRLGYQLPAWKTRLIQQMACSGMNWRELTYGNASNFRGRILYNKVKQMHTQAAYSPLIQVDWRISPEILAVTPNPTLKQ